MKRESVQIHARRAMTPKRRLAVFEKAEGRCQCGCGEKLKPDWEVEHSLPIWVGGTDDLDNLEAWNAACHQRKTRDEATARAKVKRLIAKSSPDTRKPSRMKTRKFQPKPEGYKTKWPTRPFGS